MFEYGRPEYHVYNLVTLQKLHSSTNLIPLFVESAFYKEKTDFLIFGDDADNSPIFMDYTTKAITKGALLPANAPGGVCWFINGRTTASFIFSGKKKSIYEGDNQNLNILDEFPVFASDLKIHKMELVGEGDVIMIASGVNKKIVFYDLSTKNLLTGVINSNEEIVSFCYDQKDSLIGVYESINDKIEMYQYDAPGGLICADPDCDRCGFKNNYCLECKNGKILEKGICVLNCEETRKPNIFLNLCTLYYCRAGEFNYQGGCVSCPVNKILDTGDGICYTCEEKNPFCASCKGGSFVCEVCENGYELNVGGGNVCEEEQSGGPSPPPGPPQEPGNGSQEEQEPKKEKKKKMKKKIMKEK